jgi:SAM-dependent methyltransferase
MADHRLRVPGSGRLMAWIEAHGLAGRRQTLLARARGRVLDIGAAGAHLGLYPAATVTSVVAIEPDAAVRRRLAGEVGVAPFPVQVVATSVDEASFEPASFETVVITLVLCTAADVDRTAEAIRRWLTPSGELLFLEHVVAPGARGRLQRALTPVWARVADGCHLDRDTVGALRRAGLLVSELDHFALPGGGGLIGDGVVGVAKPRPLPVEAVA